MSDLAYRVDKALHASRLSQSDLARQTKLSRATVNDWMTGRAKTIQSDRLFPVARALGVDPEWLATGIGSPDPGGALAAKLDTLPKYAQHAVFALVDEMVDRYLEENGVVKKRRRST